MNLEQLISELQERNRKKFATDSWSENSLKHLDAVTTDTAHKAYQAGVRDAMEAVEGEKRAVPNFPSVEEIEHNIICKIKEALSALIKE